MRFLIPFFCLALTTLASADDAKFNTQPAKTAAESWLKLVDAGSYDQSWKESAEYFRNKVPAKTWVDSVGSARTPFGKLMNRKLKSEKAATSLPGAPDGKYVSFMFDTSFEKKKNSAEVVTAMLDKDGKWRIAGYFIK